MEDCQVVCNKNLFSNCKPLVSNSKNNMTQNMNFVPAIYKMLMSLKCYIKGFLDLHF